MASHVNFISTIMKVMYHTSLLYHSFVHQINYKSKVDIFSELKTYANFSFYPTQIHF